MSKSKIIGLRTTTPDEIKMLTSLYPMGYHKTHSKDGFKLPYNGVFVTDNKGG